MRSISLIDAESPLNDSLFVYSHDWILMCYCVLHCWFYWYTDMTKYIRKTFLLYSVLSLSTWKSVFDTATSLSPSGSKQQPCSHRGSPEAQGVWRGPQPVHSGQHWSPPHTAVRPDANPHPENKNCLRPASYKPTGSGMPKGKGETERKGR